MSAMPNLQPSSRRAYGSLHRADGCLLRQIACKIRLLATLRDQGRRGSATTRREHAGTAAENPHSRTLDKSPFLAALIHLCSPTMALSRAAATVGSETTAGTRPSWQTHLG